MQYPLFLLWLGRDDLQQQHCHQVEDRRDSQHQAHDEMDSLTKLPAMLSSILLGTALKDEIAGFLGIRHRDSQLQLLHLMGNADLLVLHHETEAKFHPC